VFTESLTNRRPWLGPSFTAFGSSGWLESARRGWGWLVKLDWLGLFWFGLSVPYGQQEG
jgi:hypothetical protein